MKRKGKFVTPRVKQSVPLYLETDVLQAGSVKDYMNFRTMGQEVEDHDLSDTDSYSVELY